MKRLLIITLLFGALGFGYACVDECFTYIQSSDIYMLNSTGLTDKLTNLWSFLRPIWFYLFLITLTSSIGLLFLYLNSKKQIQIMEDNNTKYTEVKRSLKDSINNFRDTITSFNSLLKSLDQEKQIVSFFNEAEKLDDLSKVDTLEELFLKLDEALKGMSKQAKDMEDNHKNATLLISKIEDEINVPTNQLVENYKTKAKELALKEEEITELKKQINASLSSPQTMEVPKDIYINANILVSPGPRKDKENDTELGEDATGIISTPKGTFFWVLDGTSDSPSIVDDGTHVFSSRILAQLMNNSIRNVIQEFNGESYDLKSILIKSVNQTKIEIIERLKNTTDEIKTKITDAVNNNLNPYSSTTVLIGFLSKTGHLRYFYLGDSEVLSYKKKQNELIANKKDENSNPSRLFISIVKKEQGSGFTLKTNAFDEKLVQFTKEEIDVLIAFSDGIGASENSLRINPKVALSKISLVNQLTYDDKTLLVLERCKV